jgi:hypothetical protein
VGIQQRKRRFSCFAINHKIQELLMNLSDNIDRTIGHNFEVYKLLLFL